MYRGQLLSFIAKGKNPLRKASFNIGRGLSNKEEFLKNTIIEHDFDVLVSLKLTLRTLMKRNL